MAKLDRLHLGNADVNQSARASMEVINALQNHRPEYQMAGLTAAFLFLCEHLQVRPTEAFSYIQKIMNHADGRRPEFKAVKMYLENEL